MRDIYAPPFNRDFTAGKPGDYIMSHGYWGPLVYGNDQYPDEYFRVDSGFYLAWPPVPSGLPPSEATDPSPKITVDDDGNQFLIFENSSSTDELFVSWLHGRAYYAPHLSGRIYFNISKLPTGPWTIIWTGDWGEFDPDTGVYNPDPVYAYLRVGADGKLQWWITTDGTETTATAVGPQSVRAIEPGRWLRLEWEIVMTDGTVGDGLVKAQLFYDDVQATTPSEEISGAPSDMGSQGAWYVKMGVLGSTHLPSGESIALDNLSLDFGTGMPGPYKSYYSKYELGDLIYPEFAPLTENLGDPDNALRTYVRAMALLMQPIRDISADGPNGEPGWSQALDATRVRAKWLAWLAQMVGYRPPAFQPERDDEAAYLGRQVPRMIQFSSHKRGSVESLIYALQEELNGKQQVEVVERVGGNAWRMDVSVHEEELMTFDYNTIFQVALRRKAAGILLGDPPVTVIPRP